ncbi:MAG: hypothetical protein ACLSUW_00790 [Akkermansia sp.]
MMDKAGLCLQEHGDMIISSTRGDTDNVIGRRSEVISLRLGCKV